MNSAAARITRGAIALLSVFGLFFGATAIAAATPAKPPKPPIEKVAICNYDTYTSAWQLASVKTSVADKLIARGVAAYPLQPVPGTDGAYVFDAACVPRPVTVKVTYSGNEATAGSVPSPGTGDYNTVYTVASNSGDLVRTGYTFAGWNTASDGSGTTYLAGTGSFTLTADLTLYAKWTPVTVTVTYSGNESTAGSVPSAGTGDYNTVYTVASNSGDLVRTGYTFAGWNTASDGSGTTYLAGSGSFTLTSDLTLYAKWTPVTVTVFAVAYSDRDTTDGAYNPDVDVLIAKLVDFNNDGTVSSGDKVITYKYPTWYDITDWASDFGAFTVTEHVISGSYGCDATSCSAYETVGVANWNYDFYKSAGWGERYTEGIPFGASTTIQDDWGGSYYDRVELDPGSPSQPQTRMPASREGVISDEAFVDVDIYVS